MSSSKAPRCEPLCSFGDRLYFTTFPHPAPHPNTINSYASQPGHAPRVRPRPKGGQVASPDADATYYYFTIDDQLLYLSFFQDWGPLNLAQVYKACILIHELLEDPEMASHRLVLYSSDDPRRKANAACLMALYVMIVQRRAPWEAFHPIAELEFMPFRDAGRGPSDFNLNIQDCLWGMWKGMQNGLCDMNEFSVDDYEYYEKVENGDWNWLTPNFIAFASPVDAQWLKNQKDSKENQEITPTGSSPPSNHALQRKLPTPFVNCLDYFEKRNIKMVVRLNNQLYDKTVFLDRGIEHLELYFDDGTNPTDDIVREFLDVADRIIEAGGVVAVHCKAGLGRTGTLIGAYMIWKYGFTANEAIAFMRIVRPGSVVGPQQQYMYLKQLEWTKWAAVDEMRKTRPSSTMDSSSSLAAPVTPPANDVQTTPKASSTSAPNLMSRELMPPVTPGRHIAAATAQAKAIAPPGQPRKTPKAKRSKVETDEEDEEGESGDILPDLASPPPARQRAKTIGTRSTRPGGVTASEARPTRVTRSTAGAAVIRKTGTTAVPPSPVKASVPGSSTGPNKIPRLAAGPTVKASAAIANAAGPSRNKMPPPTPSRLPTRVPKRPTHQHSASSATDADATTLNHLASQSYMASTGRLTRATTRADAWMTNNASNVVVPGTKTARPGLRSVRKRRSSFSSADVVA